MVVDIPCDCVYCVLTESPNTQAPEEVAQEKSDNGNPGEFEEIGKKVKGEYQHTYILHLNHLVIDFSSSLSCVQVYVHAHVHIYTHICMYIHICLLSTPMI